MSACPKCQHTHVAGDVVVAGSRFASVIAHVYQPRAGGRVRATRDEVQADLCKRRISPGVSQ